MRDTFTVSDGGIEEFDETYRNDGYDANGAFNSWMLANHPEDAAAAGIHILWIQPGADNTKVSERADELGMSPTDAYLEATQRIVAPLVEAKLTRATAISKRTGTDISTR